MNRTTENGARVQDLDFTDPISNPVSPQTYDRISRISPEWDFHEGGKIGPLELCCAKSPQSTAHLMSEHHGDRQTTGTRHLHRPK